MMGWRYGYGMMRWGWFPMMIIPLILIIIIVYVVVKSTNRNSNIRNGNSYNKSMEILNERLAKGEISEEEYLRKKDMLMK